MKCKGLITVVIVIIMIFTVTVCEDAEGMEHTDEHGSKCSIEFIKSKNKKRYVTKG